MKPTAQQQAVIDFVNSQMSLQGSKKQSLFISAVAGAGKTSLLMMLAEQIKQRLSTQKMSTVMCAFNVHIAKEITKRLENMGISWKEIESKTINGLGNKFLTLAFKNKTQKENIIPNGNPKYRDIIDAHMEKYLYVLKNAGIDTDDKGLLSEIKNEIKTLTSFARNTQTDPKDEEALMELVYHYDLSIDPLKASWPFVWKSVRMVIAAGKDLYQKTGIIDYDDQIVYPVELKLSRKFYDIVCVDEAQDLNRAKIELLKRVVKDSGMLIFVGDEYQAIQGFSGSDTNSVKNIINEFGCQTMPLSVCFRCDADIIAMAKQIVPHIEARANAPKGIVKVIKSESQMFDMLQEGKMAEDPDLVLCRINADLVTGALECIRRGKRAVVRGQNIGQGILSLLKRVAEFAGTKVEDLDFKKVNELIQKYAADEVERINRLKDAEEKVAKFLDRIETLNAVMEAYLCQLQPSERPSSLGLQAYLETFIDDSDNGKDCEIRPIIFSSVHRAKGSEFKRVFIIRPELMPFPAAKQDWQVQQELNILYVAITRAKEELYFVEGVPGGLQLPEEPVEVEEETPEESIVETEGTVDPIEISGTEEVLEKVLDFGKHQGKSLSEIAAIDPKYLKWLASHEGVLSPARKWASQEARALMDNKNVSLQFEISHEENEIIAMMREMYSQEVGTEIDLGTLLKQIIKASPIYQKAELSQQATAPHVKIHMH